MSTSELSSSDFKGLALIRDAIRYRGQVPSLRVISTHLGFKSRRSATLLIERLINKGYLARTANGNLRVIKEVKDQANSERTIEIPLVGSAPCGAPLLAEQNIEAMIPVSQRIVRPGTPYFLLRAAGTSMNLAGINDGDLVIVRQQPVAENGNRVVALIDDEATIKEFRREGSKVVLVPRSTDKSHKPIILEHDFMVQGIVIDSIPYPAE
jgi:repressor LexA